MRTLLACGLILLLHSSFLAYGKECGQGEGNLGNARVCFDNHILLTESKLRSTDAGEIIDSNFVQVKFKNYPNVFAIALLNYGQSCVIKISNSLKQFTDQSGNLNRNFITKIIYPALTYIDSLANNDCVVEVQRAYRGSYAIVDFISQSMIDGEVDGVVVVNQTNIAPIIKEIPYLEHMKRHHFDKFIWQHSVYSKKIFDTDIQLYQVGYSGVVYIKDGKYLVDYITGQNDFISSLICSSSELKNRYKNTTYLSDNLKHLLYLNDAEIALRALPGIWNGDTNIEAAAYVFCK